MRLPISFGKAPTNAWVGGVLVAMLMLTQSTPALATTAAIAPQDVQVNVQGAKLSGRAKLTVWGFQIYNAALWVAPGFKADDFGKHAFALDLEYLREFSGEEIADRSLSEIRRLTPLSEAQEQQWTRQMRAIFPTVRSGDRLTGVHVPGVGAKFLFNGKSKGEIRDAEFANLFFGIWLSGASSEPKMRRELLAGLAAN